MGQLSMGPWRRAWARLLLAMCMVGVTTVVAAAPMVVLDRQMIDGKAFTPGKTWRGRAFKVERPGEPVWVAMDFVGEATKGDDSEVSFRFFFEGVPMPAGDTVALFRARFMRKVAGQPDDVRRTVLMKMVPTDRWPPGGEDTMATLELARAEGLVPRSMSIVVGQGDMPPELREAIDQIRGSWFTRYRPVVLLIVGALVLGGVVWWRLLRSN